MNPKRHRSIQHRGDVKPPAEVGNGLQTQEHCDLTNRGEDTNITNTGEDGDQNRLATTIPAEDVCHPLSLIVVVRVFTPSSDIMGVFHHFC